MPETPKLNAALVVAQREARAVGRDARNQHHGYRYASAESIIDEGRTALSSAGLALLPGESEIVFLERELDQNKERARTKLRTSFVLLHESGEERTIRREWPIVESGGRPADKATGGADTTALAYLIRDLLLLPRDDDKAAMDHRADRDDRDREPPRREERPANDAEPAKAGEERPHPFARLMPIIRERKLSRDEIVTEIDRADLSDDERKAIEILVQVYAATSKDQIVKLGAAIKEAGFGPSLREWTLAQIRPAWDALETADAKQSKGAA